MSIKFTKMQAFGNDYVYIYTVGQELGDLSKLARELSDRRFGIGSDGMILICPSDICDFRMRVFNPDGTEGEMCGNALRSVSKYVYDYKLTDKTELTVETLGGIQHVKLDVKDGIAVNILADIGHPRYEKDAVPVITDKEELFCEDVQILDRTFKMTSLSWGNPHTVIFLDEDLYMFNVEKYGRAIENHLSLFPKRTNVTFAIIDRPDYIRIREWERGTGETIGCGTGCCTAVAVAHRLGLCANEVSVEQIGGILKVYVAPDGRISMKGPSNVMFDGVYKPFDKEGAL